MFHPRYYVATTGAERVPLPPPRPRFRPRPLRARLRVAGAAWRWRSSTATPTAVAAPQAQLLRSRRASFQWAAPGGPDGARSCSQLAEAHRGTVPRAPGRIWLGRVISTRMPTRRDADGRAARAASMVWCRLGRHFAPVRQGVNHPVCADMSGLRGPVPLRSVLPSPAGQDHRSWVRPVASGPPVCLP